MSYLFVLHRTYRSILQDECLSRNDLLFSQGLDNLQGQSIDQLETRDDNEVQFSDMHEQCECFNVTSTIKSMRSP